MPTRRLMLQLQPDAPDVEREISDTIEKSGGRLLPAPRIFPPVIHFSASEEVAKEIQEKYESSIMRIMSNEEEDD